MFIARLRSYDYCLSTSSYYFYDNIIIKNRKYNIEKYRKKKYKPSKMAKRLVEIYISGDEFWDFRKYADNKDITGIPGSLENRDVIAFENQCGGCIGGPCCRGLTWQGTKALIIYEIWYEMCGWGTKSKQQSQSKSTTQQKRNIMV